MKCQLKEIITLDQENPGIVHSRWTIPGFLYLFGVRPHFPKYFPQLGHIYQ